MTITCVTQTRLSTRTSSEILRTDNGADGVACGVKVEVKSSERDQKVDTVGLILMMCYIN